MRQQSVNTGSCQQAVRVGTTPTKNRVGKTLSLPGRACPVLNLTVIAVNSTTSAVIGATSRSDYYCKTNTSEKTCQRHRLPSGTTAKECELIAILPSWVAFVVAL
ncbi:unnamed protein product [Toxocara canis]|uniref:Uncharacterized protein n=1 Tax=Toxocara canis TaxID=6265 RepID=A0A183UJA2_TOXCA|nr:unnamed protein product [Toxocara canis]